MNLKSVCGGRHRKSDFSLFCFSYFIRQWGTRVESGVLEAGGLERAIIIRRKKSVKNTQKTAKSDKNR